MSYADQVFISMCEDILENGTSTEGEKAGKFIENGQLYILHNGVKYNALGAIVK